MQAGDANLLPFLQQAAAFLNQRRFADARRLLAHAVTVAPASVDAQFLLGAALRNLGEAAPAERHLRLALQLDPRRPNAMIELARLFGSLGRYAEIVVMTDHIAATSGTSEPLLIERADALQALRRLDEALNLRERIAREYPGRAANWHNAAALLGDLGVAERAEAAARRALALCADAAETWLVLARALQSQNRLDEAEEAFRAAIGYRPSYVDALRDYCQLRWMRTGDVGAARATLGSGQREPAAAREIRLIEARLLSVSGDDRGAYDLLMEGFLENDVAVTAIAASLAVSFDPARALHHARRAVAYAPNDGGAERVLVEMLIANNALEEGRGRIEALLARNPTDQSLIALQWTLWKLSGDPRADALYDYDTFIVSQMLETPPGWSDLSDFLGDLAGALTRLHLLQTHPFDQSLRNGSQTTANLLRSDEPVIAAFRDALDRPIRHYLARLGNGHDRLRARNIGQYRFAGMWSVRLRPTGFHTYHTHAEGWLSSAFYVALPEAIGGDDGKEGWLAFGKPGFRTPEPLEPAHFVKPEPGKLVLFPSYMWHGTIPCSASGHRLSVAFDVVPGPDTSTK